ncbi:hypothetical protein D3C73_1198170 [compost metagenome]
MHDQRQARVARGADMAAKAFTLPVQRFRQAVIVQPGFADGHDLGMFRQAYQFFRRRIRRVFVVGVDAHRGPQIGVRLNQGHQAGPFGHVHADNQRVGDLVGGHALKNAGKIGRQLGKIQMTVRINVHDVTT